VVDQADPAPIVSGMLQVTIDAQGRLKRFAAMPPEHYDPSIASPATSPFDWSAAFSLAGLDIKQFKPAAPTRNPLGAFDSRSAWTGSAPPSKIPLRVEAASWHGKPTYFALIGDWTKPSRSVTNDSSTGSKTAQSAITAVGIF